MDCSDVSLLFIYFFQSFTCIRFTNNKDKSVSCILFKTPLTHRFFVNFVFFLFWTTHHVLTLYNISLIL